jgi:hypothetical protein
LLPVWERAALAFVKSMSSTVVKGDTKQERRKTSAMGVETRAATEAARFYRRNPSFRD